MLKCPSCGHENGDGDKYCSNCGTALTGATATPEPEVPQTPSSNDQPFARPGSIPPPVDFRPSGSGLSVEDEWRMSSLGPPPKRKRRLWLWIIIGLIGLCILICVGFSIYVQTDAGSEWWEGFQTEVAEEATNAAD